MPQKYTVFIGDFLTAIKKAETLLDTKLSSILGSSKGLLNPRFQSTPIITSTTKMFQKFAAAFLNYTLYITVHFGRRTISSCSRILSNLYFVIIASSTYPTNICHILPIINQSRKCRIISGWEHIDVLLCTLFRYEICTPT